MPGMPSRVSCKSAKNDVFIFRTSTDEKEKPMKWLRVKMPRLESARRVFVAARHGSHDLQHKLTAQGMSQMAELADAVRKVAVKRGLAVEILSSTEPCALYGAQVIARELGIDGRVMPHECFRVDSTHKGDCELAVKIVESLFRDGVILLLVSNVMMSHRLVRYIAGREGFDAKMGEEIRHGSGLMVAKKGVSIIPRPQ